MSLATISIQLDEDVARIYLDAPTEKQQKIETLLSLWLREFEDSTVPLSALMDQISDNAQQHGLTEEKLESLLREE